ncbi:threonine aldolase family protein [Halomarina oriensis]|uniref:Low specificity L-threonine aldolase n=1 Tax=Halomarina oriensis TaxID=671145 RepID=A0A6B0GHY0_9EURY|nr:GntG family PLP-dependent aldolase [Halomarina oriensis]MWG34344.1 low specificity L-threonine aldolase [Halomarina oriensis]
MSEERPIDMRSDTVTRPSDAMREAARDAPVGDDVYREDPTVNDLESRVADLLGFEASLYVPSGTMGNQIAARVHTERGEEAIVERESHVYKWELGGFAQHAGLQVRPVDGDDRGVISPAQVHEAYVEADGHRPGTGLVCLEDTHNSKGGTAIAPTDIDAVADAAHDLGVPVHLDGARLANASVALDSPLHRLTHEVDSTMMCLSKGLGAPVGSMLAGSEAFVEKARRVRKLFGGGMRQAGIVAGPGLLALENVERLAEDHEHAALLAEGLEAIPGVTPYTPETNIVLGATDDSAEAFLEECAEAGVLGVPFDDHLVRFVTHWDVSREDVETALDRLRER